MPCIILRIPWSFKCIDELKLLMMFAAHILTGRVKMMLIFITIKAILFKKSCEAWLTITFCAPECFCVRSLCASDMCVCCVHTCLASQSESNISFWTDYFIYVIYVQIEGLTTVSFIMCHLFSHFVWTHIMWFIFDFQKKKEAWWDCQWGVCRTHENIRQLWIAMRLFWHTWYVLADFYKGLLVLWLA